MYSGVGQVGAGRIARIVAGEHFQQQGAVFGRVPQRADLIERAGERDQAIAADAAVGRLQAGDAAERRRLADRAAGVGADRERRHARRQARRRPAAASRRERASGPTDWSS